MLRFSYVFKNIKCIMLLHLYQRNIDENIHMFTLYKEKIGFLCTNVMIHPFLVPKFLIYTISKSIKHMA
jgi:hypothetical protein